jgi:hypothetical protein
MIQCGSIESAELDRNASEEGAIRPPMQSGRGGRCGCGVAARRLRNGTGSAADRGRGRKEEAWAEQAAGE